MAVAKDDKDKAEEVSPEVASRRAAGKTDYPVDEPEPADEAEAVNFDVPAAGQDPDSRQRLAKTLTAAGVDVPKDLSVDTPTREGDDEAAKKVAGAKRADAGQSRLSAEPSGRTAAPSRSKAVEEK
jgi:hypothetical protein